MSGEYIGERRELLGYRALLITERRGLAPGRVLAQFNSVPASLGDPRCLRKLKHRTTPVPLPGDLRFGWHEFDASEFLVEETCSR